MSSKTILILLFMVSLLNVITPQDHTISIPLFLDFLVGARVIIGNIGTPSISLIFSISLTNNHSAVFPSYTYNSSISSSIHITDKPIAYSNDINGQLATESFNLSDFLIPNIEFIYITDAPGLVEIVKVFSSTLCFSRSSTSILNQLYTKGIIAKRIFSIGKQNFTIGDIDDTIKDFNVKYTKAIEYENKWANVLKGIVFGSVLFNKSTSPLPLTDININDHEHLSINEIVIYKTNQNSIVAPFKYFNEFVDKYFTKAVMEKYKCDESVNNDNHIIIECLKGIVDELQPITLFIDDIAISIQPNHIFNNFFECFTNSKTFRLKFNKNTDDNIWVFGAGTIHTFHLIFDEDNRRIGYSCEGSNVFEVKSNFPIREYRKRSMMRLMSIYILLHCLSVSTGIGLLLYIRIKIKSINIY